MKSDTQPLQKVSSLLTRRQILHAGLATAAAAAFPSDGRATAAEDVPPNLPNGRPAVADRRFKSPVIEDTIVRVKKLIPDPTLAAMFERCFPNTLDTTVFPGSIDGHPDTFVITGDIDAMWLRDSSAQVHPYLQFAKEDKALASLLQGLIRRQSRMILIDSYANAFNRSSSEPPLKWAVHDKTEMKPGVAERKWEIDSLCYTVRLAHGYWRATGDASPFDSEWKMSAWRIVQTFREQQRFSGKGPYSFGRLSMDPYDTVPLDGYGNPARATGMVFSMFRPSDDCCLYPLFVPANLFALRSLMQIEEIAHAALQDAKLAAACNDLALQIQHALQQHGTVRHPIFGTIWAYEVDGYGNALMMDDANAPSLLSLPYLGCCTVGDPQYQRTRKFVLSTSNPYFFQGKFAEGVGSPHTGMNQIWPIALTMRALTSEDDSEIVQSLKWLRGTTAGTDFMHESFDADQPATFTRPWFAWANTLFGELILKLADGKPHLLQQVT
jgi:uncharacterized protein